MSEEGYKTEVAVTSTGEVLAILHDQVLVFDGPGDLNGFLDELRTKVDACSGATSPLDERTAKEAAEEAIHIMEDRAKALSATSDARESNGVVNSLEGGLMMGDIMNAFVTFFREDGVQWKFQVSTESVLELTVTGQNGKWLSVAHAFEEQDRAVFYSLLPVNAPKEKYPEIIEYLTRVNWELVLGNFEFDYSDGEIRFRTAIDVEGDRLVPSLVKQMVYANLSTVDRNFPGIMKVLYGDVSVSEALESLSQMPANLGTRPTTELEQRGR